MAAHYHIERCDLQAGVCVCARVWRCDDVTRPVRAAVEPMNGRPLCHAVAPPAAGDECYVFCAVKTFTYRQQSDQIRFNKRNEPKWVAFCCKSFILMMRSGLLLAVRHTLLIVE